MSRPRFLDADPSVISSLEYGLGARIRGEVPAEAGFTRAVASTLTLDDGRLVFVKAGYDPHVHEGLRNAVDCDAALADRTLAPAVTATAGIGDPTGTGGWMAVAWDHVPGGHVQSWSAADVPAVVDLAARLASGTRADLVTATIPFADAFAAMTGTFTVLAGATPSGGAKPLPVGHLRAVPVWAGLDLDHLTGLEACWVPVLRPGGFLQHGDLRRDNLIAGADGRLRLLDWTHRWTGPGWVDLALLMPDLIRDGVDPETVWNRSVWAPVPDRDVNVLLAGLTGYWFNAGHRPELRQAPGLRVLQRAQGAACAAWLAGRLRAGRR
jgi:hypothetical protein